MKKVLKVIYAVIIMALVVGIMPIKAENVYKSYVIGEKITAQIDDKGHTGNFIVIANSDTKSDEVAVIQQNKGLDTTLKALKIRYDSNGDFIIDNSNESEDGFIETLEVTNAEIRAALTFTNAGSAVTTTDRFLSQAAGLFNGYIRTGENKKFGVMTTTDYAKMIEDYGQDSVDKVFKGQNYWLSDGSAYNNPPQFTDNDDFVIDSANNKFIVNENAETTYTMGKYARVLNAEMATTTISGNDLLKKYEPAIMFTLCKKYVVTPDNPNPDTADMNIIIMVSLGVLALGVVVISTKKILSM